MIWNLNAHILFLSQHFNHHLFCCFGTRNRGRNGAKSTCCPMISGGRGGRGGREVRRSFRHTSYNSDGGNLNGSTSRVNGLRRASTLTSTTSVRTKVTWDKSPTPSQRQRLLTINNRSGNGGNGTNSTKPYSSPTLLLPKVHHNRRGSDKGERFHLYTNPAHCKLTSSVSAKNMRPSPENENIMTSFIENNEHQQSASLEYLT